LKAQEGKMAGKGEAAPGTSEPKKPSMLGTILGFLLATLLAIACGFGLVWALKPEGGRGAAGDVKHGDKAKAGGVASGVIVKTVPAILTNLGGERPGWVKLELLALLQPDTPSPDALVAELSQDVMALMRTVSHGQLVGASGIQALREDLDHIAHVRSKGKSRGLLIRTLVIE
jgi:flagellar FliL protein